MKQSPLTLERDEREHASDSLSSPSRPCKNNRLGPEIDEALAEQLQAHDTLRTTNTEHHRVPSVFEIFGLSLPPESSSSDPSVPPSRSQHQRNVSWGHSIVVHHDREPSDLSQPSFLPTSSRFLDKLAAPNPLESEAAACILHAMEHSDTPRPRSFSDATSLPMTPAALNPAAVPHVVGIETSEPLTRSPRLPRASPRPITRHRQRPTMEEELSGLAAAIDAMHAEHHDPVVADPARPAQPRSSTDAFNRNASVLYRRMKEQQQGKPSSRSALASSGPGSLALSHADSKKSDYSGRSLR